MWEKVREMHFRYLTFSRARNPVRTTPDWSHSVPWLDARLEKAVCGNFSRYVWKCGWSSRRRHTNCSLFWNIFCIWQILLSVVTIVQNSVVFPVVSVKVSLLWPPPVHSQHLRCAQRRHRCYAPIRGKIWTKTAFPTACHPWISLILFYLKKPSYFITLFL